MNEQQFYYPNRWGRLVLTSAEEIVGEKGMAALLNMAKIPEYKASNITEAHIIAGMLNAHYIETYVGGFYLQGGVGDLSTFDFATIFVDEDDVQKARELIAEYKGKPVSSYRYPEDDRAPGFMDFRIAFLVVALSLITYYLLNT